MDADSVSHMMHCEHLITDDDYEAIVAAPNDSKMNTVILQYIKKMDIIKLNSFCDILKLKRLLEIFCLLVSVLIILST